MIVSRQLGDLLTQNHESIKTNSSGAYRNVGLMNRGRGLFAKPTIRGGEISAKFLYPLRRGQVVYSKLFAREGSVAIVGAEFKGCFVSSEFPHFDVVSEELDLNYLAHVLASDFFFNLLSVAATGMGQRRQRVNVDAFLSLRIPVPSLDEQRRIAARLDAAADVSGKLITSASNLESTLSAIRQQIFQAAANRSAQVPADEIFTQVHRRVDVRSDASYEMLGVRSFARGSFASGILAGSDTSYVQLRRVEAGDLVYPKLMAWEGAFAVVPQELGGRHVSPEFCVFTMTDARADPEYLKHLFAWPEFLASISGGATGTNVRRRRLQPGDFLKTNLPLPKASVQRDIVAKLNLIARVADTRTLQAGLALALPQSARNEVFAKLV